MVIFLRNSKDQTIFEVEVWEGDQGIDVSGVINIKNFSRLLLGFEGDKTKLINDFHDLSEIRGWYWEMFKERKSSDITATIEAVKAKVMAVGDEYLLRLNID